MTDRASEIRLLDGGESSEYPPAGSDRLRMDLPVLDEVLPLTIDVPQREIRLAEIVPLIRAIDDRVVPVYLRAAAAEGRTIYCRKGCNGCCDRYLIICSPAEMYYQMEFIEAMPPDRRSAVRGWLDRLAALAGECGLPQRLSDVPEGERPLDLVEEWWLEQGMDVCPFHAGDGCGSYPQRFLACREHHAESPPENCVAHRTRRMRVPLTLVPVPCELEERLTGEPGGAVSLPLMKLWSDARQAEARRTWPAREVVECLLEILDEDAAKAQQLSTGAVVYRPEPPEES